MPLKQLKIIVTVFALIVSVGVTGFMLLEDMSPLDAFYFTIATVATVGYGDVVPITAAGKFFAMFIIVTGVGMTYYTLTFIIGLAVEGQLKNLLGRRSMDRKIASLKGHIVVCGAGRVGSNVVERLRHEQAEFVVVENDQITFEQLVEQKVLAIHGDATLDEVLIAAGVKTAKGIITALSHDADNVYVTLTAKSFNPGVAVVARAERPEAEEKLRRAGANTVIFPSVMGGRQMVSAMTRPVIMDFVENVFYNQELHLDIAEIRVNSGSVFAGVRLADSEIKDQHNSIVVAIKRGDRLITNPEASEIIAAGDIMIVLGHRAALNDILKIAGADGGGL